MNIIASAAQHLPRTLMDFPHKRFILKPLFWLRRRLQGHLNLILRSRRVQACAVIAALAALVVWAGTHAPIDQSAKLLFVGAVLLSAMLSMAVIIARLATAQQTPPTDVSPRILELAAQLQASDINVARLAARVEQNLVAPAVIGALDVIADRLNALENAVNRSKADDDEQRLHAPAVIEALDVIAERLNALENAQSASKADDDPWQRLTPAIDRVSERLNALENVAPAELAARLEARMVVLEDQLCANAVNVERLTRGES